MALMKYTDKFWDILDKIGDKVAGIMIQAESNLHIQNEMGVDEVDRSFEDWCFDVKIRGKWRAIKIGSFLREFFGTGTFSEQEIKSFSEKYNKIKNDELSYLQNSLPAFSDEGKVVIKPTGGFKGKPLWDKEEEIVRQKVEVPEWKWEPKNVRNTFIGLTTETYPHGHEEEVVPFIKNAGLEKDEFGNYYKIIGKSETMFTSHLDTADRKKSKVTLCTEMKNGEEHFISDGNTIIGADDKAGVTIMLYMMAHNIPGVYYFFIGEERGGIGSGKVSSIFEKVTHLQGMKRCVSFDRRNYYSIITEQLGMQCCSDEFGEALAKELNKSGMKYSLDPTGIYTDSANFIDQIPECTNISVGYFSEHTVDERQNINFLEKLAKASINVNWEGLPTAKKIGFDEDILVKYGDFLDDFNSCPFHMGTKMTSDHGRSFIRIEMDEPDYELVQEDLLNMASIFSKNNMDPNLYFEDEFIKIELVKDSKYPKRYLESFNSFIFETWSGSDEDWDEEKYKPIDAQEEEETGEMSELCYWIQRLFSAKNLDSKVEPGDDYDIVSYIFLNRKEKISTLLRAFEVATKIRQEIPKYEIEVELYENKKGLPILKFDLIWNDSYDDDEIKMEDDEKIPF